jgi:hypothetical protein
MSWCGVGSSSQGLKIQTYEASCVGAWAQHKRICYHELHYEQLLQCNKFNDNEYNIKLMMQFVSCDCFYKWDHMVYL